MNSRITTLVLCLAATWATAQDDQSISIAVLKSKTIEELMELTITSAARKETRFVEAATAIQVLTDEDIRRSGATTLPDILRLATGVHVAQADGRTWGITSRGFNLTTANKMLVLMDGRSLYTPLFAGVLWDAQDYLLADIERIEVIRGPGATMWGANAVNGVINIITRSARETQGTLVTAAVGDELRALGGVRYGDRIGEQTYFRVYARYADHDQLALRNGHGARDERQFTQGGFRMDSYQWEKNLFTVQGDLYHGWNGVAGNDDELIRGGNFIARWRHEFHEDSDLQVQAYYDRVEREFPHLFNEDRDTLDLDMVYRIEPHERHELMIGADYRWSGDQVRSSRRGALAFIPPNRAVDVIAGFIQHEIRLIPYELGLMLGSKLEYNDFSGFEYQPSARIAYTPTPRQTVWSAVSRAVRTASRIDEDFHVYSVTPTNRSLLVRGSPGFMSEELIAYELGYRFQPHQKLSFDIATFYNDYHNLRSQEPSATPTGLPFVLRNKLEGYTYGAEITANAHPFPFWRLRAGYTAMEKRLEPKNDSRDPTRGRAEGHDPSHMLVFHSGLDLPANFEFDAIVRYVDRLPDPHVPSYVAVDLRLGWQVTTNLEVSVVGRNLLDDRHPELGENTPNRREVERSVYGRITWRF